MDIYTFWLILWTIVTLIVSINGLLDATTYQYSTDPRQENKLNVLINHSDHADDMCKRCHDNFWYDDMTEECTETKAVVSSVSKLENMITTITSLNTKEYFDPLLSHFLYKLLGGYIPDCPLECQGESEDVTFYICSFIGHTAVKEFDDYLHRNMNTSRQGKVEVFVSRLRTFRTKFCSRKVRYIGAVASPRAFDAFKEDRYHETVEAVTKETKEKTSLEHVGLWFVIAIVGLLFIAGLLKLCHQVYLKVKRHQYSPIVDTPPDRNSYSSESESSSASRSAMDTESVDSLDVNSLFQDSDCGPVHVNALTSSQDALSVESGSTKDEYMGVYALQNNETPRWQRRYIASCNVQ